MPYKNPDDLKAWWERKHGGEAAYRRKLRAERPEEEAAEIRRKNAEYKRKWRAARVERMEDGAFIPLGEQGGIAKNKRRRSA